jgi:hypothetical protein
VTCAAPAALGNILQEISGLIKDRAGADPKTVGFVLRGVQAASGQGMLLVGLFAPDTKELRGHGVLSASTITLAPRLEDLASVLQIEPAIEVSSASISLYLPAKLRLGTEGRLKIQFDGNVPLEEEWLQMIRLLYRDCSRVELTQLSGGYNAKTFRVASYDNSGRRLLPTVLKIGAFSWIEREKEAHRAYVEKFILNNSTTIMGTATAGPWAALRYNFVGIAGPDANLTWLLPFYREQSTETILKIFDRLYTKVLKPWYGQPRWEPVPSTRTTRRSTFFRTSARTPNEISASLRSSRRSLVPNSESHFRIRSVFCAPSIRSVPPNRSSGIAESITAT